MRIMVRVVAMMFIIGVNIVKGGIELPFRIIAEENNELQALLYMRFLSKYEMIIGTPPQYKKILLSPSSSLTWLLDANNPYFSNEDSTYNSTLSNTFKERNKAVYLFSNQPVTSTSQFFDSITLGSMRIPEALLVYAHLGQKYLRYSSIGLFADPARTIYTSFLSQLIKNGDIDYKAFVIDWIGEDAGMITLGKKAFDRKDYVKEKEIRFVIDKEMDAPMCYIRALEIGNGDNKEVIEEKFHVFIDETFRFIQIPMKHKEMITSRLTDASQCEEVNQSITFTRSNAQYYTYYLCNKNTSDKEVVKGVIQFTFDDGNVLEIDKEDCFIEYDNDRVMLIFLFMKRELLDQWIIGRPYLKKYTIDHDFQLKKLFFYKHLNKPIHETSIRRILCLIYSISIILNIVMIVILSFVNYFIIRK